MIEEFYLAHECVGDPMPRRCVPIRHVSRHDERHTCVLVSVSPPLRVRLPEGHVQSLDKLVLVLLGDRSLEDIGNSEVIVDIVICPTYSEDWYLDEGSCSRIGTGALHASYETAVEDSAIESLDKAIEDYANHPGDTRLRELQKTFLDWFLYIPLAKPVSEVGSARYDIPVLCIRDDTGEGAIPVFTTREHLLEWKPAGCLYVNLSGRALLEMATGMSDISVVMINSAGDPQGRIPRKDFASMLAL